MRTIKILALGVTLLLAISSCCNNKQSTQEVGVKYKFAFLTDVHLNTKNRGNGDAGLRKALESTKEQGASFVIFGGDNIDGDKLTSAATADSLHARFKSIVEESGVEAYYTMGNHDRFYQFQGKEDKLGLKTFEKFFGPTNIHFEKDSVHFITITALQPTAEYAYSVDSKQIEWLRAELEKIGKESPIVVSTHIPFLSLYYPVVEGNFKPLDMISNTKEVFEILNEYNVQLILQGHQHIYEQIQERNRWFVTAGAVSALWWNGSFLETQEGYLLVTVKEDNTLEWEYVDYGWEKQM